MRMSWPSKKLWAVLCDALPPYSRQRCADAQNWPWPMHVQATPSSKAVSHTDKPVRLCLGTPPRGVTKVGEKILNRFPTPRRLERPMVA